MTRRFAVIAHPVAHSLSPAMHNAAFKVLNIDATYEAFDVSPEALQSFLREHPELEGISVSLPHKEDIAAYLDGIDTIAKTIGAVNTIYKKEGKRRGTNTDAPGFLNALITVMPNLKEKRVVLIGAGGAARAVAAILTPKVRFLTIINRTIPKGVELAKTFNCRYGGKIEDILTETPDLIVNATSVGLEENNEPELVPPDFITDKMVVFDTVYRRKGKTKIIQHAEEAGAKTLDGRAMLLEQGILQFELWTGQKAPRDVMQKAVMPAI